MKKKNICQKRLSFETQSKIEFLLTVFRGRKMLEQKAGNLKATFPSKH